MTTLLELTPGLLSSAMIRNNHAVFMPASDPTDAIAMIIGAPEVRIPKTMDRVLRAYDEAENGNLKDMQLLEEFTGTGFYRPDLENGYAATLDAFPGMLALALDRIAAREG